MGSKRGCMLCGEKPAVFRCGHCERLVCSQHYSSVVGACTMCSEALCSVCNSNLSLARCYSCGRTACVDCLVQLDSVRRVCVECMRSGYESKIEEARRELARLARFYKAVISQRRIIDNSTPVDKP